jgi:RHS repeat-associated protein
MDSGRLSSVSNGTTTTTYVLNALGQRVKKSGTSVTLFVYDESGHLLGEYDGTGNLLEETVWMGDVPVATLRPNGTGVSVYYIHTDHLNTPRRISRPADNVIVWRWDSEPFGAAAANQDPDGDSIAFVYNPRFPGQYYDAETGLNYNYYRDYDPATGRYLESDPIGLFGGINTYAYASGNPIRYTDPRGTDVRVYNGSQVSGLHQGISVDTPNGPYQVSYGLDQGGVAGASQSSSNDPAQNGIGNGVVYEDPFPPSSVSDVLHTTPAQDRIIEQLMRQQVGNRGHTTS